MGLETGLVERGSFQCNSNGFGSCCAARFPSIVVVAACVANRAEHEPHQFGCIRLGLVESFGCNARTHTAYKSDGMFLNVRWKQKYSSLGSDRSTVNCAYGPIVLNIMATYRTAQLRVAKFCTRMGALLRFHGDSTKADKAGAQPQATTEIGPMQHIVQHTGTLLEFAAMRERPLSAKYSAAHWNYCASITLA